MSVYSNYTNVIFFKIRAARITTIMDIKTSKYWDRVDSRLGGCVGTFIRVSWCWTIAAKRSCTVWEIRGSVVGVCVIRGALGCEASGGSPVSGWVIWGLCSGCGRLSIVSGSVGCLLCFSRSSLSCCSLFLSMSSLGISGRASVSSSGRRAVKLWTPHWGHLANDQ